MFFFFFKQKTAYEMRISDWSSDVCSSDLRPVIFRTVDIGGDKALPYMNVGDSAQEENPAMGWRALRLALECEGLLKVQARALMEAAAGRTLNVMFPLVSEPWEYEAARDLFVGPRAWLASHHKIGRAACRARVCPYV